MSDEMQIDHSYFECLVAAFCTKRIAVIGDLMLDRYYWGRVDRVSPEAPVPVVEIESEVLRLGGAANVASNISSLGGSPLLIGVVGCDEDASLLRKLARQAGFPEGGILEDPSRPTTSKTRVIAHQQHVVRIDKERKMEISQVVHTRIMNILKQNIRSLDALIIEDYNKGVVLPSLIHEIISLAKEYNVIVTADPKFNNFFEYRGVTVFKPNRREAEDAMGMKLTSDEKIEAAGFELMERLKAKNILLTLGEMGMFLFQNSGSAVKIPTIARQVADVSGAGDTVIAAMTMALASGAAIREAATLANIAAGIVCSEVGVVPIAVDALRNVVNHRNADLPQVVQVS
jgi:D-glycero-beta-D-manno-heptose-7-phosphate kinase